MSLPCYEKYKKSGIEWLGSVPEHWLLSKTSRFFKVAMGQTILKEDLVEDGIWPVFSATDGDHYFGRVNDPNVRLNVGDLVIPARGNSIGSVKKVYEPSTTTQTTIYCRNMSREKVTPDFGYYFMSGCREYLYPFTQTAIPQITVEEVSSNPILLPSPEEQRFISSFLDRETAKIDTLVAEQQRLIKLLKEKRQAVISHAVTKGLNPNVPMKDSGIEWLGEVPAHWEVRRVKSLAKVISKGTTPTTIGAEFTTAGVRFLKAENISGFEVSPYPEFYISHHSHEMLSRSALRTGDVLVVIAGATTGKSAVLNENLTPANTNQAVSFIRPTDLRFSPYIDQWLNSVAVRNLIALTSVQSAQPNLSMEDLGNIPITVPPISEMLDILSFISQVTGKIALLAAEAQHAIDLLQERRAALISAAVTGKINVRGLAVAQFEGEVVAA